MKVSRVGGPKEAASSKKKPKAGAGSSFADNLMETQSTTASPGGGEAAPIGGVDGILAAQATADPTDDRPARRQLMNYGDDLLERLEDLQIGVLTGAFSKEKLTELAQRLRQKRVDSQDPKLNEIIQEIELRAEVEIAKYSRNA